ncbi:MAG: EAL domain-containing protein [Bacilli bacterium]|nr:EAL domain-containing protein [Bacilli bacterium]
MAKNTFKKNEETSKLALRAFAGKRAALFLLIVSIAFVIDVGLLILAIAIKHALFGYIVLGLLGLGASISLALLLILFRHNTGLDEKAIGSMNNEIDGIVSGKAALMNLKLPSAGLSSLQDRINSLLERYEHLHVVAIGRAEDKETHERIMKGEVFPLEDFKSRLTYEISASSTYRSALLLVELVSKDKSPHSVEALRQAIKKMFPSAMIGKYDETTFVVYVFSLDALLSFRTKCEKLVASFYRPNSRLIDGARFVDYCRIGGSVYPYVAATDLLEDAKKALNESTGVLIHSEVASIYYPRMVMTDDIRRVVYNGFLENFERRFNAAMDKKSRLHVLEELARWAVTTFDLRDGGLLEYDQMRDCYHLALSTGKNQGLSAFAKLGDYIPASKIDPFFEAAKADYHFAVNDTHFLPDDMASFCQNLGIRSLFLKTIQSANGGKKGLLYLAGDHAMDFNPALTHEVVATLSNLSTICVKSIQEEDVVTGISRIVDGIASRARRYVYCIDRETHKIAFISDNLAKLFPEARRGAICYKVLRSGHDAPCSHCPLEHGIDKRVISRIAATPSTVSVLEYRGARNELSTLIIENQNNENSGAASRLMDEALMIHNSRALSMNVNRDCKNDSSGFILSCRITNLQNMVKSLPGADVNSVLATLVKSTQDAGYDDIVYRYQEDDISFYLSGYTRSRAYSFAEEAAEIFALPIDSGSVSVMPEMAYSLVGFPSDVSNARQLESLTLSDLDRAKSLGTGILVDQSGAKPRKALRRDYVTNVLKEAVEKDKMSVFLQPIVDAKTLKSECGDIRAALYAPDKSNIAPAEFIPLAERVGLVSKVDVATIHNLGELFSEFGFTSFRTAGVNNLAIYLSLESILDEDFPEAVKKSFIAYHFPKGYVIFNVRMRYLLSQAEEIMRLVRALDGLGIQWSCSDFNYETDSLETLEKFGIRRIKTAQGMLHQAFLNPRDSTAFARFCGEAIRSGYHITATGIETEDQVHFAQSLGVQSLEGYYFGKPMNEEEFVMSVTYGGKKE